ncbi:MAG: hypothetical protein HYR63_18660 [Proteobacteria bacterium]|nr:hypothetical protein [Pseudomonadota bacterium]MBI3499441.1 hypothetical protein [Pseudomonadota bacterium]
MTYDLLIKGGHVIDPAQSRDGIADVAKAILEIRKGPVSYIDAVGGELEADRRLMPLGVVLGGRWWHDGAVH